MTTLAPETTTIEVPPVADLRAQSAGFGDSASQLAVTDQASLDRCGALLTSIKKWKTGVRAKLDPIVAHAHEVHKRLTGLRREILAPAEEAESRLKKSANGYTTAEERRRLRAQREAEANARREAEEKRALEVDAMQDEARRKLAEAEQLAAVDPQTAASLKLQAAGAASTAADLATLPVQAAPVEAAPPTRGQGIQHRRLPWTFRIVDPVLVPREFLCVDEQKVAAHVRAHKAQTVIPGILAYQPTTVAVTGGAL